MRYLCLAYYDPARFAALRPEQVQALVSQCPPLDAALAATGRLRLSGSLGEPQRCICLRPHDGRAVASDGPYTEAKEMVGGFFIIEAADREEAIAVASHHPAAQLGEAVGWAVELWPIEQLHRFDDEGPSSR